MPRDQISPINPETGEINILSSMELMAYTAEQVITKPLDTAVTQAIAVEGSSAVSVTDMLEGAKSAVSSAVGKVTERIGGFSVSDHIPKVEFNIPRPRFNALAPSGALGAFAILAVGATLGGAPATAETPTPEDAAKKAQAGDQDHGAQFGHTVNGAVKELDVDSRSEYDKVIADIENNPDKYNDLLVSHKEGMQSRLESFTHRNADRYDVAVGVYLSSINDDGFRRSYANGFEGLDPKAERSDSDVEQMAIIEKALANRSTRFVELTLNGTYDNHGQRDEDTVFSELETYKDVNGILIIPGNDLKSVIVKEGGGDDGQKVLCLNIEEEQPVTQPTGGKPDSPTGSEEPGEPTGGDEPDEPDETEEPGEPTGGDEPDEPTTTQEGKEDDGKIPGSGIPADDDPSAGDQWGAGDSPAVPGSSPHPEIRQPQTPTPAPITPAPETRPPAGTTPPPVSNPVPPVTGPGTPGDGSEEQVPTEEVQF